MQRIAALFRAALQGGVLPPPRAHIECAPTDFYFRFMKSYNIPEFITGEVKRQGRALAVKAKEDKGVDVRFK